MASDKRFLPAGVRLPPRLSENDSFHGNRSLRGTVSRFVLERRYRSTDPISFALQFRNDSIEVQYLSPMGREALSYR